jgi:ACS family tartrate transporter-like MFS transporter
MGPFWALATSRLRRVGGAAAIALINSAGNTGGFVGPYLLGAISDASGSFTMGLCAIAAMMIAGASLVLVIRESGERR